MHEYIKRGRFCNMINLKWKRAGIMTALSLSLIMAGCGSDDGDAQAEDNVSKEMGYSITGIEPGAGQTETNDEAIETYDSLEGWDQELASTGAMLTELDDAIAKEEPIVVSAWSPHYMFAQWDIKYLDDPKGIYGEDEDIKTLVRKGLKDEAPEAYTMIDRFHWELQDVEEALLAAKDKEVEEVAQDWIDENKETVAEWTKGINPVNNTPIELALTPWDAEAFTCNVAKIVLEQQGFNVTLTPVDPAIMFKAVATGEADATLAPWMPATHGALYEQYEDDFEDLGSNIEGAKIGLAVPSYMDIDSIEDLQPKK
jgi:glycine betaine/proline transport system substrate-binding protein